MRTGDLNILSKLTADILDKHEQNALLNAFRIAVNGSLTQFNMVDGIVDEYEDESGISHIPTPFSHMALEDNTDDGTGANTVTNIGTPTYTSGKLNNALTLDGSTDALNVDALATDIASDTTGSIAFWVKPDASATAGAVFMISRAASDSQILRISYNGSNEIQLLVQVNSGADELILTSSTDSIPDDGSWTHCVIVQDAVESNWYINGVLDTPSSRSGTDATAWAALLAGVDTGRVGCENYNGLGNDTFFDGQIDDFRYYQNKALTSEEVALLYNSGTGTEDSEIGSQSISYNSTDDYYSPESLPTPFSHMALEDNTDDGTGANAVTNIGTPTYTSGKLNNALTLDGSTDALNVDALATDIASDTTGSIAFWVKPDASATAGAVFMISRAASDSQILRISYNGSNEIQLLVQVNSGADELILTSSTDSIPDDGSWTHCVIVQDAVESNWYINGVLDTPSSRSGTDATAWAALLAGVDTGRVGCENYNGLGNDSFFVGQIDDFRYYQNKALTSEEVSLLYNTGTGTEDNPPLNMTLISETFTAEVEADSARIVLFEEDVDILTLNQDLLAYISRDGGTTYTQATLSDIGNYDATGQILAGEVDLSSQPAGTDMKYKIVSANNKDFKLHCTGKLWD